MTRLIRWTSLFFLALALVFGAGCDKMKKSAPKEEARADTKTLAASHILIAYQGATRADPAKITRSKDEAMKLAAELTKQLIDHPEKFDELARQNSDCPSRERGGDLGNWKRGMMIPEFEDALSKMKYYGEITTIPVETPFGFHIIRRAKEMQQIEVQAEHIVVTFKGALMAPEIITRSKEEAKARAVEAAMKAKAAPNGFLDVAKEYSDDPIPKLPIWTTGEGMPKEFDETMIKIKVGEVSDVVESPFGFHIFHRIEPVRPPKLAASHILVSYKGARSAEEKVTRTKEEAQKRAVDLLAKAKADPKIFDELARKESDDPTAATSAGDLGSWEKGEMLPEVETAMEKVKVGELTEVVESPFGFHIVLRKEPVEIPEMDLEQMLLEQGGAGTPPPPQ